MKIVSWRNPRFLNFGDDINEYLWPLLLPRHDKYNPNDYLLGIGTVLRDNMIPTEGRVHVVGSGAGYGRADKSMKSGRLNIVSVRGPLSAKVLGIDSSLGIIDPASLLSECDEFEDLDIPQKGIGFVPHCETAYISLWNKVCEKANIKYISPTDEYKKVIKSIIGCELIIAESLHGAIIADSFRIPWIPVTTSNIINPFKWLDWTSSLELPYAPYHIKNVSSFAEAFYKKKSILGKKNLQKKFDIIDEVRKYENLLNENDIKNKKKSFGIHLKFCEFLNNSFVDNIISRSLVDKTSKDLSDIAEKPYFLSDIRVFENKKDMLKSQLSKFVDCGFK